MDFPLSRTFTKRIKLQGSPKLRTFCKSPPFYVDRLICWLLPPGQERLFTSRKASSVHQQLWQTLLRKYDLQVQSSSRCYLQRSSSALQLSINQPVFSAGNPNVMVCERGTMFGYNDLIVDPRNLVWMRAAKCPVTADITHALQQPAGRALEVSEKLQLHAACRHDAYRLRYSSAVDCLCCTLGRE